ncbi:hypothetical protein RB195_000972 [Necator americanus]
MSDKLETPQRRGNPQMSRLKALKKKKTKKTTPRSKRKSPGEKKVIVTSKDKKGNGKIGSELAVSLSNSEEQEDKKQSNAENASDMNIANKPFIWKDNRENELEIRLEKLNKILSEIKEEKIQKIRESVSKWEAKYERRLMDLELSMLNFEKRCRYDKAELNEQISRVEEMSDMNTVMRQRIEKRLIAHGVATQSEHTKQKILTVTLNMLRGILYYAAQIRDAFTPRNPNFVKTDDDSSTMSSIQPKEGNLTSGAVAVPREDSSTSSTPRKEKEDLSTLWPVEKPSEEGLNVAAAANKKQCTSITRTTTKSKENDLSSSPATDPKEYSQVAITRSKSSDDVSLLNTDSKRKEDASTTGTSSMKERHALSPNITLTPKDSSVKTAKE